MIRGQVPAPEGLPHTIATDGSCQVRGGVAYLGYGFVATSGVYGVGGASYPVEVIGRSPELVAELLAIWDALHTRLPERSAVILCDSASALRRLDAWARGDLTMPMHYGARKLHQMAAFVAEHHPRIAWSRVKGHDGHLLNECADSLAQIGRRRVTGEYAADVVDYRARRLVQGFMADPSLAEVA